MFTPNPSTDPGRWNGTVDHVKTPSAGSFRTPPAPVTITRTGNRILRGIFWPIAVLLILQRSIFVGTNLGDTDDFTTVFRAVRGFVEGDPIYRQDYTSVEPHFLYSPGGTLLVTPFMGYTDDLDTARYVFLAIQAIAVIAAIALLVRWMGCSLRSWVFPASLAAVFLTESVTHTIQFTNINGVLLLCLVGFLILLLNDRNIWAGVLLGFAIAVKPVFAPLLFLPFVRKQFSSIGAAVAVPVVANIIAWPMMNSPREYVELTMPYLAEVRLHANVSLAGQFEYFGVSERWLTLWQAVIALMIILGLALALRWVNRDPVFWATTSSGLLFLAGFLLLSLGQMYYSMFLFPMIFSVIRVLAGTRDTERRPVLSVMTAWPVWIGVVLVLGFVGWWTDVWAMGSFWWEVGRGMIGWVIIVLAVTGILAKWTIEEVAAGRDLIPGRPMKRRITTPEPTSDARQTN